MSYATAAEMMESPEFQARMEALTQAFPERRTALLLALHQCQSELRFVPLEFQAFIAEKLGMSPAHVRGVVTFYEMFTEKQLGRHLLQVCKTLPCMLAGSDILLEHLQGKLGIRPGETTRDGKFTLVTVECLACCDGGPALMINETLYRRASAADADRLIEELE
jgi:NADH-quinone oxidoreductase subunit E